MNLPDIETDEQIITQKKEKIKKPSMFKVLLHNDDYTSMEFVIKILRTVFNKSADDAVIIMLKIHREEIGICGVYTYEIAETKVKTVHSLAMERSFPLKCTMEAV